jgi:hypothetical protein
MLVRLFTRNAPVWSVYQSGRTFPRLILLTLERETHQPVKLSSDLLCAGHADGPHFISRMSSMLQCGDNMARHCVRSTEDRFNFRLSSLSQQWLTTGRHGFRIAETVVR